MSAREVIKEREKRLTKYDWFRKTKQTLQMRCTEYGLSTTGKKAELIERLFSHLHPTAMLDQGTPDIEEEASENEDEDLERNHTISRPPSQTPGAPSDDHLRQLIRQEMNAQAHQQQQLPPTINVSHQHQPQQLSPASFAVSPNSNALLSQNPTSMPQFQSAHHMPTAAAPPRQGYQGNASYHSSSTDFNLLPPISEKPLREIKNRDFVDLNSLLPTALYDGTSELDNLYLKVNPTANGEQQLSFASKNSRKRKITDFQSWLEAWNIFIRTMVFYHPELGPELLAYQECISTFQRRYPVSSWLRYDSAFRMNIAMNKSLSWARHDEYAFNKFIRCPSVESMVKCYICSAESHLANVCPQKPFRSKLETKTTTAPSQNQNPNMPICRFFNSNNCNNQKCRFAHKCHKCHGNHPYFQCRNSFQ